MPIVIKGKASKKSKKDKEVSLKKKPKHKESKNLPVLASSKDQQHLRRTLTKTNNILSLFGQETSKIQELLTNRENDNAIDMANRAMLNSLLDLIPIAESRYRDDPRQSNAYALSNLISQIRELIADLQATADKSLIVDKVVYDILQPTMLTLAQFLIDTNYQLKKEIDPLLHQEKLKEAHTTIDSMSKSSGQYVQLMFNTLKERISKALGE